MRRFPAYKLGELLDEDSELVQLLTIEAMGGGEDGQ